jgi:hypothetical protein
MKNKILSGVFALALLATAGFGVQESMKGNAGLSDLALANVEALAQSESTTSYDCPRGSVECLRVYDSSTNTTYIFYKS